MNETQRYLLIHNRKLLSTDLRVEDVLSYLQSKFSLDTEDVELIKSGSTSRRRSEALLNLLLDKDVSLGFVNFHGALIYAGYDHLAELLKDGIQTSNLLDTPAQLSDENQTDELCSVLRDGGVPQRLRIFSQRKEELNLIRQELYKLKNDDACVIVHGMPGVGKTVLASEALRSKSVLDECFPGGVFWLTVGLSDEARLLVKAQNLCAWLDDSGSSPLPRNLEESKLRLRLLFRKHHPRSLLVLDDVWDATVMKVFDVRVRRLVTTRDASISENQPGKFFKVKLNQGFGVQQARDLLAQYTGIDVSNLPPEANDIVSETKGSPLALSMVGALLQRYPDRWLFYYKKLKDSKLNVIKSKIAYEYSSLHEAFSLSIDALGDELSRKYKDLVVFGEDSKIPREVLAVLWDTEIEDVEDTMEELVNKSLAYHHPPSKDFKVPRYSIHDLQRDILIEYVNKDIESLKIRHQKLIDKYSAKCSGDFSLLPDDNYIFWHIIDHAISADNHLLAIELLSNLHFINAKLKVTGAPDVINTYTTVLALPNLNAEALLSLEAFRHFISVNGDRFGFQTGFDLIQLALSQPKESPVYKKAQYQIATTKSPTSELYIDWMNKPIAKYEACLLSLSVNHGAGAVYSCHFSPEENLQLIAAAAGASGTVKVFDAMTGAVLHTFNNHSGSTVTACRFSPNATLLASSSVDATIKIWSLSEPSVPTMVLTGHTQEVTCCQFSPDGSQIISSSLDNTVKVWNVVTGQLIYTFDGHDDHVNYCCYSQDGSLILSASNDGSVQVWHASTGILHTVCKGESDFFLHCAHNPSNDEILCVSASTIEVFSSDDGTWVRTITTPSTILSLDFSKDAKLLSLGLANTTAEIWDVGEMRRIRMYEGHVGWVNDVSLSPNGQRLLTCSADGTCKVWTVESSSIENDSKLTMIYDVINVEKEERVSVTGATTSNTLKVFDESNEKPIWESEKFPSKIMCCLVLENADCVCVGLQSGFIQVIKFSTHTLTHSNEISSVGVSHLVSLDGKILIAAVLDDFTIKIIRITNDDNIHIVSTCSGHNEAVTKCHPLSTGSQLLTSSYDGTVKVWNSIDGKCYLTCSEGNEACYTLTSCCVTSDETVVFASCTDCSVKMWSLSDGRLLHTFDDGVDDAVRCVTCNDTVLAAGTDDSEFKIWDIVSRSQLFTVTAGSGWITDICFYAKEDLFMVASDALRCYNCAGELIQAFHIRGSRMGSILSSKAKDNVITIDDIGQLYILRFLKPFQN